MGPRKQDDSFDPYATLGVSLDASEAEISKAYKKLALKLHPDKQQNKGLSPAQAEIVAKRFHDIKEARSFLLDAEHEEDRNKFRAKRLSERVRRDAEERRERTMSDRRKHMRDELKRKEQMATNDQRKKQRTARGTAPNEYRNLSKKEEQDLESLRRRGKEMRESHAERSALKELKRQEKERKKAKEQIEQRQIRLKWDRKKDHGLGENGGSPSEHSIASVLSSQFGIVERVEILGAKGNVALVTFSDPSSCKNCVEAYAQSKSMRAKYVGKRRESEEAMELGDDADISHDPDFNRAHRPSESSNDRSARQAEEREKLLRQMEFDDQGADFEGPTASTGTRTGAQRVSFRRGGSNFPVPLPCSDECKGMSPFAILELVEESIFKDKA